MDKITEGQLVLAIWNSSSGEDIKNFVNQLKSTAGDGNVFLENSEIISKESHAQGKFDAVLSNLVPPHSVAHSNQLLSTIIHVLKPGGRFYLKDSSQGISTQLLLSGFVNTTIDGDNITCSKPNFEVGSSMKLATKAWKLEDTIESAWLTDKSDEVLDSDNLLNAKDANPDVAPLKVCGTTGQRKACANCSCGLAEELAGEVKETPKSSCGSCYLGDAFRCASCPYLGMPAFKPGEKVILDLKSDI